jgi:pilus assembly protein Flp/PilA
MPLARPRDGRAWRRRTPEGVILVTELYVRMRCWLGARLRREDGATAVEYALMVALIAIVIVAAVAILGTNTSSKFEDPQLTGALS